MEIIAKILPVIQIVLAVILVTSIMLQQSGAELGGAFGGGDNVVHHTKRGFEKVLFITAIISAILFAVTALLTILV